MVGLQDESATTSAHATRVRMSRMPAARGYHAPSGKAKRTRRAAAGLAPYPRPFPQGGLMRIVRAFVAGALACGLLGAAGAAEAPVATVGGRAVNGAELEEHVRPKLIELEGERFEALRVGLDEMVADELVKQEAKARNVTPEALEKQEVDDKVAA